MSDDEDEVSDDGEYVEEEEYVDESAEVRPRGLSAESFDFGDSMDSLDEYDEEEGDDSESNNLNESFDINEDSQSNNLNSSSVAYTEATDDRSKFQQACFDTMRMLRIATSKTINPEAARKALDLVYDNCKARFHAKERLGSSGAAEYLCKIFKRWRNDSDLLIRCCEVISEFVMNETENKILVGIQGIAAEIVWALEEHRRHWPAIQALTKLVIDLCNSKLPGMLQQNITMVKKAKLDNNEIENFINDTKIFEQTRLNEDESTVEAKESTGPNQDQEQETNERKEPTMNGKIDLEEDQDDEEEDPQANILGTESILDEDQWLIDNREKFGKAGICHIITHIFSLLHDYQHAQSGSMSGRRSGTNSGSNTPRHHLHRSSLAGGSSKHADKNKSNSNTSENASTLPAVVTPNSSNATNNQTINDVTALGSSVSLPAIITSVSQTPLDSHNPSIFLKTASGSRPQSATNSIVSAASLSHIAPALAESLRLQLPPIVPAPTHSTTNNSTTTTPTNKDNESKSQDAKHRASPTSLLSQKTDGHTTHSPKSLNSNSHPQNNNSHRPSHLHPHTHHRSPHNLLQQVLYSNHDWPIDELIVTLMRAVAVLSDFEPNAKKFGKEGLCLYITSLLKDKSATAPTAIVSARGVATTGNAVSSSAGYVPSPRGDTAVVGPRLPAQFAKTNALLWGMILLCADSRTGNKEKFGEAGATFLLLDRLHEIMRNIDTYRKDSDSRRYVEYVSWALLNLVLDSPMNCILAKQVTYTDVILDHLITMEVDVLVPDPAFLKSQNRPMTKGGGGGGGGGLSTAKSNAKEILQKANQSVAAAGGGRKTVLGGTLPSSNQQHHHQQHHPNNHSHKDHNSTPMITKKEPAMSAGIRQKLGRIREIVYCVM